MNVTLETANQPDVIALIAELDAYQDSLYPAEARYALDLTALCQPNVLFAVARSAKGAGHGEAVGCGAVVLEASGVRPEQLRAYAATGIDLISTSAPMTRSRWLDLSMRFEP